MSDQQGQDQGQWNPEEEAPKSHTGGPHNARHPIPTVQGYRQHRKELQSHVENEEQAQRGPEDESTVKRAYRSAKAAVKGEDQPQNTHNPYPATNLNYAQPPSKADSDDDSHRRDEMDTQQEPSEDQPTEHASQDSHEDQQATEKDGPSQGEGQGQQDGKEKEGEGKSATEAVAGALDPKEKRKAMKKAKRQGQGREVTDPVTHLPIIIHDQTEKDLNSLPENYPEPGDDTDTATGPQGASKSEEQLRKEREKVQRGHNGMQRVFPPPDFEYTKQELAAVYQEAVYGGLAAIGALAAVIFVLPGLFSGHGSMFFTTSIFCGLAAVIAFGMGKWVDKKTTEIFEDETWDASRRQEQASLSNQEELPESVQWLNSLLQAIWPLVNPDLFASLVDQIEDIMQASLPKSVKMVSVDDLGQGSESLRILGVRWLPTGAASQTVGSDGNLHDDQDPTNSDRTNPGKSQDTAGSENENGDSEKEKQDQQEDVTIREGLEAEEGDFVNLEMAIAYRSRSTGKSLKAKSKNAHLFLKFYLPSGIALPVWVEVRGLVMTLRLRLQLTPDPPFISLCTMTFLGQPKASIACVPLSKHVVSLTDIPVLSSFVNSSIDAALAEYVAPKSLTLNLKDMLMGEESKKDTAARGVVWIFIKKASGFKQGDGGFGPKEGSSDSYVTVSWGKFGKPVASTRIVEGQNEPYWHEHASILVTPEEINAEEKLRLQLWDSDKWSADDDLGRVELDLKHLIGSSETHNRIQDREDRFQGQDPDEPMPGTLTWSVGYFEKTKITQKQLEQQTVNKDIRTTKQLKQHVSDTAEHKLREAGKPSDDEEVQQQKTQDYKELHDSMIISAPPSRDHVSGLLSIQLHNITGLEIAKLQKPDKGDGGDEEDEAEQSDDMPDSYCTIIMNHRKIFRSRTKPKNSKPFFNAGTERFVRDWRNTEIIVSVRDTRAREDDPLIGLVYLPLRKVFAEKSQVIGNYPLVGGIGYGRARISMVWRSVELQLPANIRGWDYGTLQIRGPVKAKPGLHGKTTDHRIKLRTNLGRCKMYPDSDKGEWQSKTKDGSEFLPVRKRYSSALVIEFRESMVGPDRTGAFAVLWLHDLVDEEDQTVTLKVWDGDKDGLRKAESCCGYAGIKNGEEPLGEIEINLKFWRGLSGYHKAYAAKSNNRDLRNVMECLDTLTDEKLDDDGGYESADDEDSSSDDKRDETRKKKLRNHTNDSSTDSSSDDEEGSGKRSGSGVSLSDFKKVKGIFRSPVDGATTAATSVAAPGHNDPDDGSRGFISSLRDYKDHHKQLHRKHRGIMQWRAAREADHMGGKLSSLKGNISGLFHHDSKESGIETEV
ncbi:hypothetical protein F4780DRAFT_753804 [Xylariomycetidae sp. FL0641]|nr:hypothetical protein F4780DRAFT_753804 [Xylariomycetidae sp. FL0641]